MLIYVLLLWGIIGICILALLLTYILNTLTKGEVVKWCRLLLRCPNLIQELKIKRRQHFRNIGLDEYDSDDAWSSEEDYYGGGDGVGKPLLSELKKKRRKVWKTRGDNPTGALDDVVAVDDLEQNKEHLSGSV